MIAIVRLIHGAISLFFLACLGYVYYAAATRRRNALLAGAMGALTLEGIVVGVNGGDCPLGTVHRRFGDERTFFELFLPAPAAKRAVPLLGAIAVVSFLLVLLRPPRP